MIKKPNLPDAANPKLLVHFNYQSKFDELVEKSGVIVFGMLIILVFIVKLFS